MRTLRLNVPEVPGAVPDALLMPTSSPATLECNDDIGVGRVVFPSPCYLTLQSTQRDDITHTLIHSPVRFSLSVPRVCETEPEFTSSTLAKMGRPEHQ